MWRHGTGRTYRPPTGGSDTNSRSFRATDREPRRPARERDALWGAVGSREDSVFIRISLEYVPSGGALHESGVGSAGGAWGQARSFSRLRGATLAVVACPPPRMPTARGVSQWLHRMRTSSAPARRTPSEWLQTGHLYERQAVASPAVGSRASMLTSRSSRTAVRRVLTPQGQVRRALQSRCPSASHALPEGPRSARRRLGREALGDVAHEIHNAGRVPPLVVVP